MAGSKRCHDEALGGLEQVWRQEANELRKLIKPWSEEEDMDDDEMRRRLEWHFNKKLRKAHPEHASKVFSDFFGASWDPEANRFRSNIDVHALLETPGQHEGILERSGVAKPVGIKNNNNVCYLIAILQLFNCIPAVRRALLEVKTGLEEEWPEDLMPEAAFACQVSPEKRFVHLLQEVLHSLQHQPGQSCCGRVRTNDLELAQLARQLENITAASQKCFKYGEQHDAHELAAEVFAIVQKHDASGELRKIFGGSWRQAVVINDTPGRVSKTSLDFFSPSEPTIACDGSASLSDAIRKLLAPAFLTGENQYKDADDNLHDATKTTHFAKIPSIICFTLKLPQEDNRKVPNLFTFDEQIELTEVCDEGGMETTKRFELFAVVAHDGNTMTCGHYWIYVRQEHQWFCLNCDAVRECERDEVLGGFAGSSGGSVRSAYVLCFVEHDAYESLFQQISRSDMQRIDTLMDKRQAGYNRLLRNDTLRPNICVENPANDVALCPSHPEDPFSLVKIDTTFTLFGSKQVSTVQQIYELLQYRGNKLEYFRGSAKFAMRKLDFNTHDSNVENYIFGDCQSGKSAEAAFAAWCCSFILGCLPIVTVRNQGGKVQGTADMRKAMIKMNERVKDIVMKHFPGEDPEMYTLQLVDNVDKLRDCLCVQSKAPRKLKPMVCITLNNPTQLRKLFFNTLPRKKWYPAQVIMKHPNGDCTVRYNCSNETEKVLRNDVRHYKDAKRTKPVQVGSLVDAAMSEELKTQEGVFNLLVKLGPKDKKVRAVFILDEADLTVGGPKRNGNAGERLHHHEMPARDSEIHKMFGTRKGIREYAYGSICITATPAAPLLCEWPVETCGLCGKDLIPSEDGAQLRCDRNHLFHESCLKDFLADESRHDGFPCPTCERMRLSKARQSKSLVEDNHAVEDEGEDEDEVEVDSTVMQRVGPRRLSPEDYILIELPSTLRSLRPHLVRTDRPTNYICYEELKEEWDNCATIIRMETPERIKKTRTKTEIYQALWTGTDYGSTHKMGDEQGWAEMVREAKKGEPQDLWWGLKLRASNGSLQVSAPPQKSRTDEEAEVFDLCQRILNSYKEQGTKAWDLDRDGITQMLTHMREDVVGGAPFRHALILSENTKQINNQASLQQSIAQVFKNMPLAVARYECKKGITVLFTKRAELDYQRAHGKRLIDDAEEVARQVYATEKGQELEQDLANPKRSRDLRVAAETLIKAVEVASDEPGLLAVELQINVSNINLFYQTMKLIRIKQSIAITGTIGGRGVSYHDIDHEIILTDMYSGMSVDKEKALPTHGEDLLQRLGRLCTIETFSKRDPNSVPEVRLWASRSFHEVHCFFIRWLLKYVKHVEEQKNGRRALECMDCWVTGNPNTNKTFPASASRAKFTPMLRKVPQGPERQVPLPDRTSRALDLSYLIEEGTRTDSMGSEVMDASAIHVSDNDMQLRRELLMLDATQRIVVPNIISSIRESESLGEDDPAKWMSEEEALKLLPKTLLDVVPRDVCEKVFRRLCELGLDKQAKLVQDINVDDVYVGLGYVPNTVELLQSAKDWKKESRSYKEMGLYSIRPMPIGVFCHCNCPDGADRVLRKSDLRRCTFCLWYYHACTGEGTALSASEGFVCSACRGIQDKGQE